MSRPVWLIFKANVGQYGCEWDVRFSQKIEARSSTN